MTKNRRRSLTNTIAARDQRWKIRAKMESLTMTAEKIAELIERLIDTKLARQSVSGPSVHQQAAKLELQVNDIKSELVAALREMAGSR
jgi:hypothetical protein